MSLNILCQPENDSFILSSVAVPEVVELVFREFAGGDTIRLHTQLQQVPALLSQACNGITLLVKQSQVAAN